MNEFFDLIAALNQYDSSTATQLQNDWMSKDPAQYASAKSILVQCFAQSHQTQNHAMAEILFKLHPHFA